MSFSKMLLAMGSVAVSCLSCASADDGKKVGEVTTAWAIGSNHKVVVERFDDPKVNNAACFVSYAKKGGITGSIGLAENPNRFSIACRAVGRVLMPERIPESETVFKQKNSPLFKDLKVERIIDRDTGTILYLVYSTKLIDGSTFNSVSAINTNIEK